MKSSWLENLPSERKKAIEELVKGREFAKELKFLLNKQVGGDVPVSDLVKRILSSFTNTLSILNTVLDQSDEVTQLPPCEVNDDGQKFEDSDDSSKSSVVKNRRGCYKRRRNSNSWTTDSPALIDDGHAWRKYGQKQILRSKYPRNYFRCTHKYDQNCQALKQVQRISEDPCMYRTTYYGNHTCKSQFNASELITDIIDTQDSSVLLSFNTNNSLIIKKEDEANHNSISFSSFHSINQENVKNDKKVLINNISAPMDGQLPRNFDQSLASDYNILSPDDKFYYADMASGVNSSCTTTTTGSSHSLDMEPVVESVDFDVDYLGYQV